MSLLVVLRASCSNIVPSTLAMPIVATLVADRVGDQKGKCPFVNRAKDALVSGEQCGQQDDAASVTATSFLRLQGCQSSRRSISSSVLPISVVPISLIRTVWTLRGRNPVIAPVWPPDLTFNMRDGFAT